MVVCSAIIDASKMIIASDKEPVCHYWPSVQVVTPRKHVCCCNVSFYEVPVPTSMASQRWVFLSFYFEISVYIPMPFTFMLYSSIPAGGLTVASVKKLKYFSRTELQSRKVSNLTTWKFLLFCSVMHACAQWPFQFYPRGGSTWMQLANFALAILMSSTPVFCTTRGTCMINRMNVLTVITPRNY